MCVAWRRHNMDCSTSALWRRDIMKRMRPPNGSFEVLPCDWYWSWSRLGPFQLNSYCCYTCQAFPLSCAAYEVSNDKWLCEINHAKKAPFKYFYRHDAGLNAFFKKVFSRVSTLRSYMWWKTLVGSLFFIGYQTRMMNIDCCQSNTMEVNGIMLFKSLYNAFL